MDTYSEPHVRLEPAVSEEWLRRVVLAGHSPNDFASWVLASVDIEEMLRRFAGEGQPTSSEESLSGQVAEQPPIGASPLPEPELPQSTSRLRANTDVWTKNRFFDYLDLLMSVDDMVPSVRLLGAYLRLGPIPSSQALKDLCGFDDESDWQTALRVAKQRLTIQARRMDSPPLFRRAKAGKEEGQRLHPIEPLLFTWMKEWGREHTATEQPEDAFPDPERWGWDVSGGSQKENDS